LYSDVKRDYIHYRNLEIKCQTYDSDPIAWVREVIKIHEQNSYVIASVYIYNKKSADVSSSGPHQALWSNLKLVYSAVMMVTKFITKGECY
jgi:hypothetical protein